MKFKIKNYRFVVFLFLILFSSFYARYAYGWSNGGFSIDYSNPNYGTHDWIAQHALDWLPENEKAIIISNILLYLYGTELPDNSQAQDGIGDTIYHHAYYYSNGTLQDDSSAKRAQQEFDLAYSLYKNGDFSEAVKRLGAMTHYISDLAVFGHVMGSSTDWGNEKHHSDYESYVNERTNSYNDEFNIFLSFDGSLEMISAYEAALYLAFDTTFDTNGDLTCLWMDNNYDWSNPTFRNRCGESINLAVNLIADVLHTFYIETSSSSITITFSAIGLDNDANTILLTVDGIGYSYSDLPKSFFWEISSSHNFEWSDIVSASPDKRYSWVSTIGLTTSKNGLLIVPSDGGSIIANYKTQYYLKMNAYPSYGGKCSPSSGWYDEGNYLSISAIPNTGYRFDSWFGSGLGSYTGNENPAHIFMNGPIVQTANFEALESSSQILFFAIIAIILLAIFIFFLKRIK